MKIRLWLLSCAVLTLATGCVESGEYVYGDRFDSVELNLSDTTLGVHPSTVVLTDPNNPFRAARSGVETKWDIESAREPIAAFYSWATWLATEPTGEHQYYAALNLRSIYQRELVAEGDLGTVREMAIEAFRSVLEHFPDAVTYDITGTVAYPIAIDAYRAMIELGGDPGDWRIVLDAAGEEVLIK